MNNIIRQPLKLQEFIHNSQWCIPEHLYQSIPSLRFRANQVIIPLQQKEDFLIWNHTDNGSLSVKDAYSFKRHHSPHLDWAKCIWSADIPPSKSLISWRLMHDKLPNDEHLMDRGCYTPSMCSLCHSNVENSFHLFFECPYSIKLWCWFASVLNMNLQFHDIADIWKLCDRGWTPQCKLVVKASIINIINSIWFSRNQARFNDKVISWESAIAMIQSNVSLAGNNTKLTSTSSIRDFVVIKKFNIEIHPPRAPTIKEVYWHPPIASWVKCNTDGAATAISSSCGGIFRDNNADFICCFAENLPGVNSFVAEICGALRAIEIAAQRNWRNLWIETDSSLVVLAFKSSAIIPCNVRNRWENCKLLTNNMNFLVTHIYREGNQSADKLANVGLTLQSITTWLSIPLFLNTLYINDKLGLPSYRFQSF